MVEAAELGRYGVTANAIAPSARTRMTEAVFADTMAEPDDGFDAMAPRERRRRWWCGSAAPSPTDVTGRVFEVEGGIISVADGWQHGPGSTRAPPLGPAEVSNTPLRFFFL